MAAPMEKNECSEEETEEGNPAFGCEHYKRKCILVAPCCGKSYPCRICHNDVEDHELDRKSVEQVVCAVDDCKIKQSIKKSCEKCGIVFGNYYCDICRLFDDVDKQQFHCDGCGICRIGGKDNYFHCSKCDVCLHNNLKEKHKCVEKVSRNNCPVCLEDLHTSREECSVLGCGHLLHRNCMREMLKSGNISCAICGQSMVDMSDIWSNMDEEIAGTPMPDEYKDFHVQILCKDCHKECRVLFHVIGLKCKYCGSYNTCRVADRDSGLSDPSNSGSDEPSPDDSSPTADRSDNPSVSSSPDESSPNSDD